MHACIYTCMHAYMHAYIHTIRTPTLVYSAFVVKREANGYEYDGGFIYDGLYIHVWQLTIFLNIFPSYATLSNTWCCYKIPVGTKPFLQQILTHCSLEPKEKASIKHNGFSFKMRFKMSDTRVLHKLLDNCLISRSLNISWNEIHVFCDTCMRHWFK